MSICGGIAGTRGCNPIGFFIHNDAGGASLDADWWANAYATGRHNLYNGFVHYHVDKTHVVQTEDDSNIAWHCGDGYCNKMYLSLEVDQSMGATDSDFLIAEDRALQFVADVFKQYGIKPNANTVRLHQEVYATACPHRSVALHGGAANCKQFFIDTIKAKMNGQDILKEMEDEMICIYKDSNGLWYYYNGIDIKLLYDQSHIDVLRTIYKKNHDGKDIPILDWSDKQSPWDLRLRQVVGAQVIPGIPRETKK